MTVRNKMLVSIMSLSFRNFMTEAAEMINKRDAIRNIAGRISNVVYRMVR